MSLQSLVVRRENVNTVKAETGLNTLSYLAVEVPNSMGAQRVDLVYALLQLPVPETVAATVTIINGALLAGKKTPTGLSLDSPDQLLTKGREKITEAGPAVKAVVETGPDEVIRRVPIRPEQDGRYYVTIAIKSTAATAVQSVFLRAEFDVYR